MKTLFMHIGLTRGTKDTRLRRERPGHEAAGDRTCVINSTLNQWNVTSSPTQTARANPLL